MMRAVELHEPGGDFHLVEREVPEPGPGEVRVAVEACGICHSDAFAKQGTYPGIAYPLIPGHEVAGRIDALGEDVDDWEAGERVGVGWHGGHCFGCDPCRRGDFVNCEGSEATGISRDGGYAEYMIASTEALAAIPGELAAAEAAPLLCAGITTYNGLRNSPARPGDVVAVLGIGGLGHLGLQYARQMGFYTVAISGSPDKEEAARELGADDFLDLSSDDPVDALQEMGGARVILATAPDGGRISDLVDGLAVGGQLLVVAATMDPLQVAPLQLVSGRRSIQGWPSGHARDSQDTLEFSAMTGVRPRIETFPLEEVEAAYERMIGNRARFRVVLTLE